MILSPRSHGYGLSSVEVLSDDHVRSVEWDAEISGPGEER